MFSCRWIEWGSNLRLELILWNGNRVSLCGLCEKDTGQCQSNFRSGRKLDDVSTAVRVNKCWNIKQRFSLDPLIFMFAFKAMGFVKWRQWSKLYTGTETVAQHTKAEMKSGSWKSKMQFSKMQSRKTRNECKLFFSLLSPMPWHPKQENPFYSFSPLLLIKQNPKWFIISCRREFAQVLFLGWQIAQRRISLQITFEGAR